LETQAAVAALQNRNSLLRDMRAPFAWKNLSVSLGFINHEPLVRASKI
jgi:hypothetical protein